jgi:hypothetical protein
MPKTDRIQRSLEQFAAFPKEAFSTVAADPTSIRIDRVAFRLLINPRLWPAIGFADVGANLQQADTMQRSQDCISFR